MLNGKKRSGFTIIEIMVVVVIIGMLAAIIIPRTTHNVDEARITSTKAQIVQIGSTLQMYHLNNGFFPTTDQGLKALIEKPTTPPEPKNYPRGGYMSSRTTPQDAWGNDFIYRYPGERDEYDIISLGADGKEGGEGVNADIFNGMI
ncbi:MAG: type II secretion system major pseudopilin GspG [Synergistaceae bacterium]|jgi:general secretion pathway protein G|nr:type II secretion system major pseudopilin GspG [Synergistaceae bacterium]